MGAGALFFTLAWLDMMLMGGLYRVVKMMWFLSSMKINYYVYKLSKLQQGCRHLTEISLEDVIE